MFIVIEGTDGSGKSTLCQYLSNKYHLTKKKSIGGAFAEAKKHFDIDKVDLTERFSFLCGEAINNSFIVSDCKKKNESLIFDRYYFSTLVYCETMRPNISKDFNHLFSRLEQPDLVIFINVTHNVMLNRIKKRGSLTLIENKFADETNYNQLVQNYINYLPKNTIILENNGAINDLEMKVDEILKNQLKK